MTEQTEFSRLFRKYINGSASAEETRTFLFMVDQEAQQEELKQLVDQEMLMEKLEYRLHTSEKHAILDNIYLLSGTQKHPVYKTNKRSFLWLRFAAAASVLIIFSLGLYYTINKKNPNKITQNIKNDIAPGGNRAILTLSSGQQIVLTAAKNGKLAQQGNIVINKIGNGLIAYNGLYSRAAGGNTRIEYNTVSVPRGGTYALTLADGSKVWLNAQSSITFPTAFNGKERIVRITGEALFEVAHNAEHPFKVQTGKQTIEDIGTTFDVNAYTDEAATQTTLIEGKVKVNDMFLEPGQQSDGSHIKTVNTDVITAWKTGNFHFDGEPIQAVMRQLARWYDIDVSYQGEPTKDLFYADISRNCNISAVLKLLESTNGVHFNVEGRRVTVIE